MADFIGSSGADNLSGTSKADFFDLSQGGADTIHARGGEDIVYMGATLDAADSINGGSNNNQLILEGDYSTPLQFEARTISNFGVVTLLRGFDYSFIFQNGNVRLGIEINGSDLRAGDSLEVDLSAVRNERVTLIGGRGDDTLIGASEGTYFQVSYEDSNRKSGADKIVGGAGADLVFAGNSFDRSDRFNAAGGDEDSLHLTGDYASGLTITGEMMVNFENLALDAETAGYHLVLGDKAVGEGLRISVDDEGLAGGFHIDASAAKHGGIWFRGSATDDRVIGGRRADWIEGGDGADTLSGGAGKDRLEGGAGADRFLFRALAESSIAASSTDHIIDLENQDIIDVSLIDANINKAGNQAFKLVDAFTGAAGQMILQEGEPDTGMFAYMDVDGDGEADAQIQIFPDLGVTTDYDNFAL